MKTSADDNTEKQHSNVDGAFSLLQSWYVARLRTAALELSQNLELTALSRITTDRKFLERFIGEASKDWSGPASRGKKNPLFIFAWFLSLGLLVVIALLLNLGPLPLMLLCAASLVFLSLTLLMLHEERSGDLHGLTATWHWLRKNGANLAAESPDKVEDVQRKFAELALEGLVSERTLAEFSPYLILALEENLQVAAANMASLKLLGYAPSELVGRNVNSILSAANRDLPNLLDKRHSGRPIVLELSAVAKSGERVEFILRGEWSRKEQLFFCELEDVTQRKAAEQLRNDFVNMVSHDLRSPLTAIQFGLSLIAARAYGDLSEDGLVKVGQIEQEVERLITLVNELLDVERFDSGQMQLDYASTTFSDLIMRATNAISHLVKNKRIQLSAEGSGDTDNLCVDGNRLVQVLVNLLSNAIKYSPDGGRVTLAFNVTGDILKVEIADEGPGIDPSQHKAIFDKFYQVKGAETKPGSGLGLAICQSIIEAHKGQIGVESSLEHGSTFWFTVPTHSI